MSVESNFIEQVAPLFQKYAKQYGYKICSSAIAQACLESAYGTSYKAKFFNITGLKYRPNRVNCNNGYFEDGGSEQNPDGTYTNLPSSTAWYSFASMDAGVEGYYQFINISNYAKAKSATTPLEYLNVIKNAGYATSINYVQNVNNVIIKWGLTKYDNFNDDQKKVGVEKSTMIDCEIKSPHHSGPRTHAVDRITPHCVVGQLTAEQIGNLFNGPRKASCNYGIGTEGRVCLVVDEENRSWCSSSKENDQRAITIECASDKTTPYAFNDIVYDKLINLCADILKRYGKKKLLWIEDEKKALAYEPKADEMLLTVHRWFAPKACPGDWLYSRMSSLAAQATKRAASGVKPMPVKPTGLKPMPIEIDGDVPFTPYIAQITANSLNIRQGAGTSYPIVGVIKDRGKYTIVEEKDGWGKLKSGIGWISLNFTKKI